MHDFSLRTARLPKLADQHDGRGSYLSDPRACSPPTPEPANPTATPMPIEEFFVATPGRHGNYSGAIDFLNLNAHLPFPDVASVKAAYPDLQLIRPATAGDYRARLDSVKDQCNVIIEVDTNVCGGLCYVATQPRFQRLRHVFACGMMQHKARGGGALRPLVFDEVNGDEYVVVVHVRRGDANLHADDTTGKPFFANLKAQIDEVLQVCVCVCRRW